MMDKLGMFSMIHSGDVTEIMVNVRGITTKMAARFSIIDRGLAYFDQTYGG